MAYRQKSSTSQNFGIFRLKLKLSFVKQSPDKKIRLLGRLKTVLFCKNSGRINFAPAFFNFVLILSLPIFINVASHSISIGYFLFYLNLVFSSIFVMMLKKPGIFLIPGFCSAKLCFTLYQAKVRETKWLLPPPQKGFISPIGSVIKA